MKKILLGFLILFCLTAFVWADYRSDLLKNKVEQFVFDLDEQNFDRLIHYFDPNHIISNLELWGEEINYSTKQIDFILLNWGFIQTDYSKPLKSFTNVDYVIDYFLEEDSLEIWFKMKSGEEKGVFCFINWESLTFYGAAG